MLWWKMLVTKNWRFFGCVNDQIDVALIYQFVRDGLDARQIQIGSDLRHFKLTIFHFLIKGNKSRFLEKMFDVLAITKNLKRLVGS